MPFLDWLLGTPLGWVLRRCYLLTDNYGIAIVLFAIVVKIVLFPLSMLAQHNAIIMAKLKPQLDDIKRRFEGNNALILAEQRQLYKTNHYSSFKGSLPLLIQIPVVLGVISVVYHPLRHIVGLTASTIASLTGQAAQLLGTTPAALGLSAETRILQLVQQDPSAFAGGATPAELAHIGDVSLSFLGVNLAALPTWGTWAFMWPILSGLSALAMSLYQNKYYVLQRFSGPGFRWGMAIFMVAFSGYFALVLPCAFGLYWTAGNLLTIVVTWLCNVIENPRKQIDYTAMPVKSAKTKLSPADRKAAAAKSRHDARLFRQTPHKEVMFYSEGSGYWKYFAGLIEAILAQSDIVVHYVTSDIHDRVFDRQLDHVVAYYVSPRRLISFMMRLDVDLAIMTLPDLENYHIKRSLVRRDIDYVYVDHGMTSLHLTLREHALDHFDTIFCNGPNHIEEMRQTEAAYGLPAKRLIPVGYPLFDDMMTAVQAQGGLSHHDRPIALIAPSWQPGNILELCAADTVQPLLDAGFDVIIRPHPEFVKRFADRVETLRTMFADALATSRLELQTDFSSNSTVYNADIVVTDWSTIAQEFAYVTKKPSIFVNTPMKIMNPNYARIAAEPLDISLRDQIGVSLDIDQLPTIAQVAQSMIDDPTAWSERIGCAVEANLFHVGTSAQAGADYVVQAIEGYRYRRRLLEAEQADDLGSATDAQRLLLADEAVRARHDDIQQIRDQADRLETIAQTLRRQADDLEFETAPAQLEDITHDVLV